MFLRFIIQILINTLGLTLAALMVNIEIISPASQGFGGKVIAALLISAMFGLVTGIVRLGGVAPLIFYGLMLWLAAWVTESSEYGVRIHGFWSVLPAAIVMTVVHWALSRDVKVTVGTAAGVVPFTGDGDASIGDLLSKESEGVVVSRYVRFSLGGKRGRRRTDM
ncbi:phage holin family protein [Nocardia tengchongensis]|uniref:phage holin family protein n=1 Tax=Nocardia tengchongensis TaxID=2055889 RepID=UPI0036D20361